ncbi:MAG: hypothetical protein HPY66_0284 [Firmicutes bacterium]|nr:hypothetical protein [Bacillota bacterium]MDI6704706.1 hypothetical protein [Bacillota bacterium]
MGLPIVVCYTTERALEVLKLNGAERVEIIKTKANIALEDYLREERVICQRNRDGKTELVVS